MASRTKGNMCPAVYAQGNRDQSGNTNTYIAAIPQASFVIVDFVAIPISLQGGIPAAISTIETAELVVVHVVAIEVGDPILDAHHIFGSECWLITVVGVHAVEDIVCARVQRPVRARTRTALMPNARESKGEERG